jgi:hypothetical protein
MSLGKKTRFTSHRLAHNHRAKLSLLGDVERYKFGTIMNSEKSAVRWIGINRTSLLLLLSLLVAYLVTASGRIDSGDGRIVFTVSQSLLENLDVSVPPPDPDLIAFDARGRPLGKATDLGLEDSNNIVGRGGNHYSPTGIGHSVLILPLLALGRSIASMTLPESSQWMMEFVAAMLFNPLVSAFSGLLMYQMGRRLSWRTATSVTLAVVYAFGTMTWVYAKSFFSDPLIALLLLLAFYGLLSFRYSHRHVWLWVAGIGLGAAALTKPVSLISAPIFAAYLMFLIRTEAWRTFLKHLVAFLLPVGLSVIGIMAYNWWRFESPFDTGYRNIGWTFPFWAGLYGLIASPGKGYLYYNPIVLAALAGSSLFWRKHKAEFWVIVALVAANLLFLAKYDHWHGGGNWGPRLLLPVTPFIILPLGSLLEEVRNRRLPRLVLATLIAVSITVQIPGVTVNYARFLQRIYDLSVEEYYHRVTFEVAYSPLIGQWFELREVVSNLGSPAQRSVISRLAFQDGGPELLGEQSLDVLAANLPDFWFIYLGFALDRF